MWDIRKQSIRLDWGEESVLSGLSLRVGCRAFLTFARLPRWGGKKRSGHGVFMCTMSLTSNMLCYSRPNRGSYFFWGGVCGGEEVRRWGWCGLRSVWLLSPFTSVNLPHTHPERLSGRSPLQNTHTSIANNRDFVSCHFASVYSGCFWKLFSTEYFFFLLLL